MVGSAPTWHKYPGLHWVIPSLSSRQCYENLHCHLSFVKTTREIHQCHSLSVCLHITLTRYHQYADLSEGIQLLGCLSLTFCLGCVSKINSILSIIFHPIYGALCIQLTHFSYDGCENMSNLSSHHHHQSEV